MKNYYKIYYVLDQTESEEIWDFEEAWKRWNETEGDTILVRMEQMSWMKGTNMYIHGKVWRKEEFIKKELDNRN